MKHLNRANLKLEEKLPIKVVQFGEGNFLRAFIEYAFQKLNKELDFKAGVAVVQPIEKGMVDMLNEQDGLYTLFMKGIKKGKEIQEIELITNIVSGINPYTDFNSFLELAKEESLEFIISNTTEAGIAYNESDTIEMKPPNSFPAKLTTLLYERFKWFKGDSKRGLTIIPCELINYNADTLKAIILRYVDEWNLGNEFRNWFLKSNSFHNTLVDRIVPGYPKNEIRLYNDQLEYHDNLIVSAEEFFLWVIEGDDDLKKKLPFDKIYLDVKIVEDMQPYRTRKVRILNGAHTSMVPFSILYGNSTVKETIDNPFTGNFVNQTIFSEIIDTLEMDRKELDKFAMEVLDRFRNPFIKHQLADIALNSISKFKVRVLPSLIAYEIKHKKIPLHLTFAMACLILFYKGNWQGEDLPVKDNEEIIDIFKRYWSLGDYHKISKAVLQNENFWNMDLTNINTLTDAIAAALEEIDTNGIEKGFARFRERFSF